VAGRRLSENWTPVLLGGQLTASATYRPLIGVNVVTANPIRACNEFAGMALLLLLEQERLQPEIHD
jgi:hypothetical protein